MEAVHDALTGNFSTRAHVLNPDGAWAVSASHEHVEQTKIPWSCTIQLPRSAVAVGSLVRPPRSIRPPLVRAGPHDPMVPAWASLSGGCSIACVWRRCTDDQRSHGVVVVGWPMILPRMMSNEYGGTRSTPSGLFRIPAPFPSGPCARIARRSDLTWGR